MKWKEGMALEDQCKFFRCYLKETEEKIRECIENAEGQEKLSGLCENRNELKHMVDAFENYLIK